MRTFWLSATRLTRTTGRTPKLLCALTLLASACSSSSTSLPVGPAGVVERPELLRLLPLRFDPPDAAALRFELANGIPVYAKEDHELPLVTVTVYFRGGSYLDPVGREGLADLTAALWPEGGAGERSAADLDDELDRLGADVTAEIGGTGGSLALDVLASHLEAATTLLSDIANRPRFDADRLRQSRLDALQELRSRNDDPAEVEELEWRRLLYGPSYWSNHPATPGSVDAITSQDCRQLVASLVRPGNVAVAVAGDFDTAAVRALLDRTFGTLPRADQALPPVPQPSAVLEPGIFLLDRPEMTQARVRIGRLGLRMGDPDELPLLAANSILGGGFTSRLVRRIRSQEGLAYDVRSALSLPADFPGTFAASLQTKPGSCAYAASIVLDTLNDLRVGEISTEELVMARSALVAAGIEQLGSASETVATLAQDEIDGRSPAYWAGYGERVAALSAADLLAAVERHLDPRQMVVLIIGNRAAIEAGSQGRSPTLADLGPIHPLPERDPLSLAPLAGPGSDSR